MPSCIIKYCLFGVFCHNFYKMYIFQFKIVKKICLFLGWVQQGLWTYFVVEQSCVSCNIYGHISCYGMYTHRYGSSAHENKEHIS